MKSGPDRELSPCHLSEYSAAMGTMVIEEIASAAERTEEGIGRMMVDLEGKIHDVDGWVDIVAEGVADALDEGKDLC